MTMGWFGRSKLRAAIAAVEVRAQRHDEQLDALTQELRGAVSDLRERADRHAEQFTAATEDVQRVAASASDELSRRLGSVGEEVQRQQEMLDTVRISLLRLERELQSSTASAEKTALALFDRIQTLRVGGASQ